MAQMEVIRQEDVYCYLYNREQLICEGEHIQQHDGCQIGQILGGYLEGIV